MERALSLLAPADALRRRWLALVAPYARGLLVDRDRRVAAGFALACAAALVLATAAPLHLLALGPLVLGVPHVLADLRYLVWRPGLHRRGAFVLFVGAPLVAVVATGDPRWGFGAVAGAGLAASGGSRLRRALVTLGGLALVAVAHHLRAETTWALAHAHNLVAVLWLVLLLPWRARLAPLGLFAGGALVVASGVTLPVAGALGTLAGAPLGVSLDEQTLVLAPFASPAWDRNLVVLFAFAQSVHYAVWLRLIPDALRPGKTPRSFSQSARALRADLGAPLLLAATVLALGVATFAAVDARGARHFYFAFALFHGYLELAALGLRFVEARR